MILTMEAPSTMRSMLVDHQWYWVHWIHAKIKKSVYWLWVKFWTLLWVRVRVMVFNATFINISAISWWSVLLVEETKENHRHVASQWQTLSYNVVLSTPRLSGELTTLVVIDSGARVAQSLNFCVILCKPLFVFCSFSFGHCIECTFSI